MNRSSIVHAVTYFSYGVNDTTVELWHSIPRVAFLAFTKTNKNSKEK
jgi:hypothetical protein